MCVSFCFLFLDILHVYSGDIGRVGAQAISCVMGAPGAIIIVQHRPTRPVTGYSTLPIQSLESSCNLLCPVSESSSSLLCPVSVSSSYLLCPVSESSSSPMSSVQLYPPVQVSSVRLKVCDELQPKTLCLQADDEADREGAGRHQRWHFTQGSGGAASDVQDNKGRVNLFLKEKAPLRVGETGGQHVNLLAITNQQLALKWASHVGLMAHFNLLHLLDICETLKHTHSSRLAKWVSLINIFVHWAKNTNNVELQCVRMVTN